MIYIYKTLEIISLNTDVRIINLVLDIQVNVIRHEMERKGVR